jgi:hypothetical protein
MNGTALDRHRISATQLFSSVSVEVKAFLSACLRQKLTTGKSQSIYEIDRHQDPAQADDIQRIGHRWAQD